jgi:LacI family gluconate utilization system Gnt-I transcriptional repressor
VPGSVGFGCAGLAQILELNCEIDAVICSIDLLALGVLVEAQSRNLCILEDLAVMGFGDLDSAAHPPPS